MVTADIPLTVTLAVLAAAFLHALWNALLKGSAGEPILDTALVVAGSTLVCLPVLPFLPFPDAAAWPYAFASMVVHFGYYLLLSSAYRHGDLSFAYPLMRGAAPLIVVVLGIAFLGEHPSPMALTGIVLICAGILAIAWFGARRHTAIATGYALANAAVIATYTLIDGTGARSAGNALSYAFWLMALEGIPFLLWIRWLHGRPAVDYLARRWRRGILAGAASVGAYAIALWAMTRAPVAIVAALREVSVVFAVLIGGLFMKEPVGWRRLAGAIGVAAGVAALRM